MKINSVVRTALFIALTFIFTLISVPNGLNGYTNFGDAIILVSTAFLGPVAAFFVGGVGSALADLSLGYFLYIPASFLIKGLIPVIFILISKPLIKKIRSKRAVKIFSALLAELFMVIGYYIFSALIFSSFTAPLISLPSDMIQAAIGITAYIIISEILEKLKVVK